MRDFTKVSPKIWRNKSFKALPTDDARLLLIYFMTSEHQNSAGCFRLTDGYALDDLGWVVEKYQEVRASLIASGMVMFDAATSEIFIVNWFEMNAAMNDRHALRITRAIVDIESDELREKIQVAFAKSDINRKPDQVKAARQKIVEVFERTANTSNLTQTGYMQRRASQ